MIERAFAVALDSDQFAAVFGKAVDMMTVQHVMTEMENFV